jgi:hypothetical protein
MGGHLVSCRRTGSTRPPLCLESSCSKWKLSSKADQSTELVQLPVQKFMDSNTWVRTRQYSKQFMCHLLVASHLVMLCYLPGQISSRRILRENEIEIRDVSILVGSSGRTTYSNICPAQNLALAYTFVCPLPTQVDGNRKLPSISSGTTSLSDVLAVLIYSLWRALLSAGP